MSVISTDSEGAKRPKGSGEIPRMRPLPCRYEVFSPSCSCDPLPDVRRTSMQVLGNVLSGTVSRSNSLNQHGSALILGISPLALSPLRQAQGPSWSVEMTDIGSSGEPSILTPFGFSSMTAILDCPE